LQGQKLVTLNDVMMTEFTGAAEHTAQKKTKVFISYSRKDIAFADRLADALRARGVEPLIDRTEIYAFEDWWKRIEALIVQADTVVFVISPDSVSSDVALKEVEFAASVNKRFAPITCRQVDDTAIPDVLRRLNFISFDDATVFDEAADRLTEGLSTDIEWIRKHTEFGEQARRWAAAGRPGPRGLLLRSPVLEDAEHWIASRPEGAPAPTEAVQAFIEESRNAATRRRNQLTGGLAAGLLVALGLAGLAFWQRGIAVEQRSVAEHNEKQANEQRDRALLTQSRFLADLANQNIRTGDARTGILLALEGLPASSERPYAPEAEAALNDGWQNSHEIMLFSGHEAPVWSAVFSPDGHRVLTGSDDKTARLWDAATGQEILKLDGHKYSVWSAAFSPDGKRAATVSWDELRLWDAETGEAIKVLRGEPSMKGVEFSPDGRRLVTAGTDRTVRIWDAEGGQQMMLLRGHSAVVSSARFDKNGRRVVTASDDGTARIWDAETGRQMVVLRLESYKATSAAFSPDGRRVVTSHTDKTARIWDAETGQEVVALRGHEALVWSAEFSPDGKRIVTASVDGTTRLWDSEGGQQVAMWRANTGIVLSARFSTDGSQVVVGGADSTSRIWQVASMTGTVVLRGHDAPVLSATFSPDGQRVVTASDDKTAGIWLSGTGQRMVLLRGHQASVTRAAFSADGRRVVTASADRTVRVWDSTSGQQIAIVPGSTAAGCVPDAAFSPDGKRIMGIFGGCTVTMWDIEAGKETSSQRLPAGTLDIAGFSADLTRLVISRDNGALLWSTQTGREIMVLSGPRVRAAAFSADGRLLATADERGARIWNLQTRRPITVLRGLESFARRLAFSADGQRIVAALLDNTARIWDVTSGKEIMALRGHEDTARTGGMGSAGFSQDGSHVVTASVDATARVWRVFPTTRQLIDQAIRSVPRCLTRKQREEAFLDPEPADWCIEMKKWPYQTEDWQGWLHHKRAGASPPLPDTAEWKQWLGTHQAVQNP
jgi:WD40 repeat protein